jgi:hypothetical protein
VIYIATGIVVAVWFGYRTHRGFMNMHEYWSE